ncbi:hypothetical protein BKA70DRAFT_1223057 [Coprinopsis sp. MPI-PUGE-AT-0042]|nr:hypothetical protein BKA70DRAFT_1223057 [Coprinopsis sp. MPI-PUGE-AT-0042]
MTLGLARHRARLLRVGRGKFIPKAKSVGVPGRGRGRIGKPRESGTIYWIVIQCGVPTRAFTNDFGTCPASGPAPQSRAREVRPKSKVGRCAESGRSRIDEPRESGTICGIGIQSGRKGQVIQCLEARMCGYRYYRVRATGLFGIGQRGKRDHTVQGRSGPVGKPLIVAFD